jgi:two-component system chemotaxis response regulator CheY
VKNILVVDDSRSMRQMLSFTLQQSGYRVIEAADGVEALELVAQTSFDLILTDQNMPRMDGLTLIEDLRRKSAYNAVPLLVLTTESGAEMKARARAAGANGWIVKPFDPQSLISTVVRMIG